MVKTLLQTSLEIIASNIACVASLEGVPEDLALCLFQVRKGVFASGTPTDDDRDNRTACLALAGLPETCSSCWRRGS